MIRFDILTVFPEMFASPCGCSLLKKALDQGADRHPPARHPRPCRGQTSHDRRCPLWRRGRDGHEGRAHRPDPPIRFRCRTRGSPIILLTPQGERFCQKMAEELAGYPQLVLICGHYEGVDERVRTHLVNREISIGDYVLTGGELSAMVVVDAVSRLVPGVLGNCDSAGDGLFFHGASGISPLHAACGISGMEGSRGAAFGESPGNRGLAAEGVSASDQEEKAGSPDESGSLTEKEKRLVGRREPNSKQ